MTTHKIINCNSNNMKDIENKSIHLIVTSPPYPMIQMWDNLFSEQNKSIAEDLSKGNALNAFNKMHLILNSVWDECDRVLIDNGFICINIGDATRTINDKFQLFSNHTAIISHFISKGYSVLPDIIWRKQSNAPNKFMGSGMYPAGAYVTYEHEYILVFRKGGKREFKGVGKELRQKSAFFWEERNVWFSDLWEVKGTSQVISASKSSRERSAAYPFEIPYRLVNMYSAEGDTVLDPFAGLGTTNLACMAANRNSIGIEVEKDIADLAIDTINVSASDLNKIIDARINRHLEFIEGLPSDKRERCYKNVPHGFDVKTKQETAIKIDRVVSVAKEDFTVTCIYE